MGAPILILGEPGQLEIVSDVLSTDAVKIQPRADVLVDGWGGDHPLRARYGWLSHMALQRCRRSALKSSE